MGRELASFQVEKRVAERPLGRLYSLHCEKLPGRGVTSCGQREERAKLSSGWTLLSLVSKVLQGHRVGTGYHTTSRGQCHNGYSAESQEHSHDHQSPA